MKSFSERLDRYAIKLDPSKLPDVPKESKIYVISSNEEDKFPELKGSLAELNKLFQETGIYLIGLLDEKEIKEFLYQDESEGIIYRGLDFESFWDLRPDLLKELQKKFENYSSTRP